MATACTNAPTTVCRTIAVAPLQVRRRDARRGHARRSCACTFVHRKSRNSVGRRTAREQEWGRKPPGVGRPQLQRRPPTHRRQSAKQLRKRLCKCVAHPRRRAYTRRSWFGSPYSADMIRCALQVRLRTTHGRLTPAAPGACAFVHRKSRNSVGGRTRGKQERGT